MGLRLRTDRGDDARVVGPTRQDIDARARDPAPACERGSYGLQAGSATVKEALSTKLSTHDRQLTEVNRFTEISHRHLE